MESFLSKIAEYTIEPVGRQVGYMIHSRRNLRMLEAIAETLKAARESLATQVDTAKTRGDIIQPDVELWLEKVNMITIETDKLLNDESQAKLKCLHGFCPNLIIRRHLSRDSTKLVPEIVQLYEESGIFRKEVRSYLALPSRMSVEMEIIYSLKDSDICRIGVYGIGGVGKTTLVKQVYKQAAEDKQFFDHVIILLDVNQNPDLEAIQKKIVEKLGMEILDNETMDGRASRLCARIQGKMILVILDDLWEHIDLEVVGLPDLPTCKILLTSRSRGVLFSDMRAEKVFSLDLLDKEENWSLFQKMAGDVVKHNVRVRDTALQVAERCGGLPLLVVTVASALKDKIGLHVWKDALRQFKRFGRKGYTKMAFLALEWSYNNLDDEELKSLFLLCGIVGRDNHSCLSDFLRYCMGLGLFKDVNTVEEARHKLDFLVQKLKDSSLLLESDVDGLAKMHDLPYDVAKRIAIKDLYIWSVSYRDELKEWPAKDFFERCTMILLNSSHIPMLSEMPCECPELKMFHLVGEAISMNSMEIPSDVFREMKKLRVLNLINLHMLSLPLSLQFLKNLRMLCLDKSIVGDVALVGQLSSLEILSFRQSSVKQLPNEIGQLTRLRLLDLSDCSELEVIPPGVISSLVRLEELRMRNSFNKWEVEGAGNNASLSELKHLSQLSSLDIHIPNADILPANLFSQKLVRFNIIIGDAFVWEKLVAKVTLNTLKLKLTSSFEQLDEGLRFLLDMEGLENPKHLQLQLQLQLERDVNLTHIINRKVVFPYITILSVHGCDHLRFVFSFSSATRLVQLKQLVIARCELIEEIISSSIECEENMDILFPNLETLILVGLPNLARFCRGSYIEFPSLKNLEIVQCSNLGAFIGDNKIWKEIEERDPEEENLDLKSETVVQYFLFDGKAGFPCLERLKINQASKLKTIWHIQLAQDSFCRLRQVEVSECISLINVLPPNIMGRLNTLEVWSCERIEIIVASNIVGNNDPDDVSENEMAFNRLQSLTLADLPSLQDFCSSRNFIMKFSSSITLTVEFCPIEMKISPEGFLLSHRTGSRILTMKKIMDELKNPNTIRIGLYGIGGVGKTTLVKEVHKQATEDKELFDDVVILLDVKGMNTDLEGIQKKIVGKLGMDILDNDTIDGRASRLSARIKDKKILVILDDVWEQIDLVAVGLPSVAACKILLTTRSRMILSGMSTQKEFLLDILQEVESWVLFEEKAGDVVKDPAIRTVAEQVARSCGGLPILVVTVASTLKQRTNLPLWKDALTCLQKGEDLTEKAYLGLEWIFNQLNDKELKPLFLLYGITIRGNSISLADLLRYSMGLGFFEKAFTLEQARKALLSRIEKLKDYCLLIDGDDNRYVGMHDFVLDVANLIANRDQHIFSLDGGDRELKEWPVKYFLEKCTIMFFPCGNNIPRLPEVMHCPALTMFHLQGDLDDDSQKISPSFFEEMKNLQVLSLRCMTIPTLPSSLQFLKNLVFLCLDKCILGDVALIGELSNLEILSFSESNVKQLPRAVGQLIHLRLLDLSDCSELEVISPGVISSLGRLEELRMRNSFNKWEVEGEGSNASLSELKHLSQLSSLEIHIPNADILPAKLFSHKLERFNIIIGDVCEKLMVETTLNSLKLKLTTSIEQLDGCLKFLVERSEDLSLFTECVNNIFHPLDTEEFEHLKHLQLQSNVVDFTRIINRKVVFPNLTTLRVPRCDGLSFLFSFSMPESLVELQSLAELKHLDISTYEIMEESLSSIREYSQENMDNMFSKWINLKLNESPDIIRLCSGSIDKLEIEGWIKMMSAHGKNTRICKEIEESHLEENLDVKRELITVKYFLFDLKAVFPNLTSLTVHECDRLSFLFSISMAKSLVELKHLEISTCAIIEEIVSSTREHGQQNMDSMFPKLEDLKLNELPNLTRFCSGSFIQLLSLEKLDIEGCSKLGAFISDNVAMSGEDIGICIEIEEKDSKENLDVNSKLNTAQCFLFDEKIDLPNLTSLIVHRCDGLSFLLLSSSARSLVKLKHLVISECQMMESVLTKEHGEENKDNMLPELQGLELKDLPRLVRFCSGSYFEFASMERMQLENCAKLETFICNPLGNSKKEMERVDTNENLETVVPNFLFDKKVGLQRLESLTINDLPKLTKIWHTQLAPNSFCRLRDVTVQQCNGLKNIFQDSIIAGVFQQLQKLVVKECGVLEEIVSQEGGVEKLMHDQFFPELACLEFTSLFQLKRFYLRMPAINWPLKTLVLSDCQKVDIFAAESLGLQKTHDLGNLRTRVKQYFVLFEKSLFPKLEDLTFSPVDIWYGRPAHEKALFPATSTDGYLPHLRTLRLHGMEKFMRLWENTEPAAGSAFPQLRTLEVKFSGLTNLELSGISFRNLTILEVTFCWRLQYLTTYSVAQSLVQLKTLKIDECKNMKEIFTSEGMGEDADQSEIVFSQLQHLELNDLISLERFCSSDCSVKVPTLGTLKVNWCPLKLKISSDNVLEVDLDVQKAHSSKEAFDTTESACSSETNQKRPAPNASEGAQHIEYNARELHDDSFITELNNKGTLLPGITGSEHGVEAVIQETPINSQNIGQVGAVIQEAPIDSQNIGQAAAVIQETPIDSQNIGQAAAVIQETPIDSQNIGQAEAVIQETPIGSQNIGQAEAVIQETQHIGLVEAGIQETPIDSQNIGQAEIMDLKQKQIVTNTQKNLQESDFGESLIEPLNANEGKQLQLKQVDGVQTESWSQSMSMLEQDDITSLRKELRANEGNSLPESPVALALPETGPSSSSGAKGSLKDKIRLLTAKRTADLPVEVIARLNALLGVNLANPSAYQQLSALLPVLQSTRMEWVVDQVREALQKLAPAADKKSSSNDLVTELTARQTQLEARKSELIAGSSQVEAECHQMMGQEAELADIKQQIKTLEARAAALEADISSGKQRYSTYESSIDQLLRDREENQASLDSANRDLLQAQVEVDSTSNFIKAHLRQLL